MIKVISAVAILALGYFLFFNESSPKTIYFHGMEYGPKQLDRSNDSNSKIFKYYSQSVSNRDYISILHPDSGTGSLSEWSDMFSTHFERQGFKFSNVGGNKVGVKNTVKIFMMNSHKYNVVFMYVLEDIKTSDHLDQRNLFRHLDAIVLD
ncbi:hypothetical protein [Gilvimarinus polysaccharolyticus]|uniref:hypothetical protein n=1 Tax=Gilvimarinus polysaccharolyticus TaxID=863921 RepID=UPI0006735468|nr:hypothetical protein [Gilvimarinus polysaccharolyticus]